MSKVIRDCLGFSLIRSVVGPEILNQPDAKQNNHDSKAHVFPRFWVVCLFSRALSSFLVFPRFEQFACFALNSDWLFRVFSFSLIGRFNYVVLVLRHSIEKRTICRYDSVTYLFWFRSRIKRRTIFRSTAASRISSQHWTEKCQVK